MQRASYRVQGGQPLSGTVKLGGAKNLASKLMIASLLATKPCRLENVPDIGESSIAQAIIEATGASIEHSGTTRIIDPSTVNRGDLRGVARNRLPVLAAAPLLAKLGKVIIPTDMGGGDQIGKRPIDFHLQALQALGATIEKAGDGYVIEAPSLEGTTIDLPYPSVGATETTLLASCWARGTTVINNAAIEPEIGELVRFLTALGARIEQAGRTYRVEGATQFGAATQEVLADRLEAVSFAAAAIATRGSIRIIGARRTSLDAFHPFLDAIGAAYDYDLDDLIVSAEGTLRPTTIVTDVHPGFMSDWQQPSAIVLLTANGTSTIHETVFEDRFGYVADLQRMGANMTVSAQCQPSPCHYDGKGYRHVVTITGPSQLEAISIELRDIRAGMAQLIAALIAKGTSTLSGIHHLDRGYGTALEGKLRGLGACIERVEL